MRISTFLPSPAWERGCGVRGAAEEIPNVATSFGFIRRRGSSRSTTVQEYAGPSWTTASSSSSTSRPNLGSLLRLPAGFRSSSGTSSSRPRRFGHRSKPSNHASRLGCWSFEHLYLGPRFTSSCGNSWRSPLHRQSPRRHHNLHLALAHSFVISWFLIEIALHLLEPFDDGWTRA